MSELPKGWVETDFDNVIDSLTNGISDKQNKESNGIPVSRIETIADQTINYLKIGFVDNYDDVKAKKYLLNDGDILFSHINSPIHLGKTAIFDGKQELFHGTNLLRIVVNNKATFPSYFNYYCKFTRAIGAFSLNAQHAVNQSSLNQKKIKAFSIPLAPLAEQKRIVEKLDEVLAQVDTIKARLDGIPDLLKRFRQSVLASAVSGKLTEEWRGEQDVYPTLNDLKATIDQERFEIWCSVELNKKIAKGKPPTNDKWKEKYQPANPKYNDSNKRTAVEGINAPWLVTSLDAVSILTTGKTPSTSKDEYWNGDTMFVSPAQIHPEGYLHNPSRYVSEEGCQVVPLISKGSTLIVCIGTVGKVGLLTKDVVINQQINAITPLPSVVHKYMYYWCKTLYPWIIDTARATVNAAILNKSTMSTAPFALPPLEEQKEIVRLVDQYFAFADTIEAQVKKAQARVDNLTQSILAKAFSGELVAQDPNDEPADKLLERIAEARKEAEALAKAAKKAEAAKKRAAKSA